MSKDITLVHMERLQRDYLGLTKAGESSLRAAWEFGNTVSDLHRYYSYTDLAEAIGVSQSTVSKYAKLYNKYGHPDILVYVAKELETFDVAKLIADEHSQAATRLMGQCQTCQSWNVKRVAVPLEEAARLTEEIRKVQNTVPPARFASTS